MPEGVNAVEAPASFGIRRVLNRRYEDALARVPEALQSEGFGILTEIDVRDTLKKKLGIEFRRYKILGACNPQFAHQALAIDETVSLLLPCNVVVADTGTGTRISAVDPRELMTGEAFQSLARQAAKRLAAALAAVPPA